MRKMYLISTNHLEDCLWFMDDEDFRVAMNYVAIQAFYCPNVVVLTFILMSNHVHFILKGSEKDVIAFVNGFKHRYSLYYYLKYGVRGLLRRNKLDVRHIPLDSEAPERAIAYVQMNCVAANICAHPSQYPWGTGNTFFSENPRDGLKLDSMSILALERLMHSEQVDLPPDWIVNRQGFVPPSEYVDVTAVEKLFRTPGRMNYFLNNSSKAQRKMGLSEDNLPAFRDQTVAASLPDLCRSLFQKESFAQLNEDQQKELTRQIRFRFSAEAHQIARVCGISYSAAAKLLDSL